MEIIALENTKRRKKPRVAAYARVSTDTEDQKKSYDSQVGYFTDLIQSNKQWVFAGVYADQGKSGVSAERRPNFLWMIEDAKAGKIDVILVKSISRFARNSLEPKIDWVCRDRRKGKKGNGCKNLIIPEEELLEALTEALGVEWNGVEKADEGVFEKLKTVKIYEDGRIEIELNAERQTA